MTSRTFELHMAPPVVLEIKHGQKNEKGYPTKLEGMIVVTREKGKGNSANFNKADDVMAALPKDAAEGLVKKIPIRLISDDPMESFHIYRGLYGKGKLACGANYGEPKATRMFRGSEWVTPYEVDCNDQCPLWNREKEPCDLGGTLYFNLGKDMPRSGDLVLYRLNGRHAQRRMLASLKILEARCDGIMAGLPLQIAFYTELVKDGANQSRAVPIVVVEPQDGVDFDVAMIEEVGRRKAIFDMKREILGATGPTNILKKGMLRDIQRRELVANAEDEADVEVNLIDEAGAEKSAEAVKALKAKHPHLKEALIEMILNQNTSIDGVNIAAAEEFIARYHSRPKAEV
jgi:hypothetical protein